MFNPDISRLYIFSGIKIVHVVPTDQLGCNLCYPFRRFNPNFGPKQRELKSQRPHISLLVLHCNRHNWHAGIPLRCEVISTGIIQAHNFPMLFWINRSCKELPLGLPVLLLLHMEVEMVSSKVSEHCNIEVDLNCISQVPVHEMKPPLPPLQQHLNCYDPSLPSAFALREHWEWCWELLPFGYLQE